MRPSRGMGIISPGKIKSIRKRDGNEPVKLMAKGGLYENIHAKRKRIAEGSNERMRKPGTSGAPKAEAFKKAALSSKSKK
jgi:hypothetical protein